ncbi:MAG: site-2 protease family protein [Candidatus Dojkabacteria bacterium]|nr:MAG: site-2 protease family protein [Candidatus Dojkabacteria bacterium]
MESILSIGVSGAIFILIIGLLVLIHEFGHFVAAKRAGIVVQEFAIGFGPSLFSFFRNGTVYSIKLLPLGGYVKMLGDQDASSFTRFSASKYSDADKQFAQKLLKKAKLDPSKSEFHEIELFVAKQQEALDKEEFEKLYNWYTKDFIPNHPGNYDKKTLIQRASVIVAGVVMNIILAIVLFYVLFAINGFSVDLVRLGNPSFVGAKTSTVPILYDYYADNSLSGSIVIDAEGFRNVSTEDFARILDEKVNEQINLRLFTPQGYKEVSLVLNGDGYRSNFDADLVNRVRIVGVSEEGTAANAGLDNGDIILNFADQEIASLDDLLMLLRENRGTAVDMVYVDSQGNKKDISIDLPAVEDGKPILGATLSLNSGYLENLLRISYQENQLFSGFLHTYNMTAYTVTGLGTLVSQSFQEQSLAPVSEGVSSIIGVANIVNELVKVQDFTSLINLTGLVSVALAFANILPIPLFDGGNLLFLVIEGIRKRPLSAKTQERVGSVTFVLLIVFMILIMAKDLFQFDWPSRILNLFRGMIGL